MYRKATRDLMPEVIFEHDGDGWEEVVPRSEAEALAEAARWLLVCHDDMIRREARPWP